jgi:ABC-2 type transport system ATP-binding protein
MDAIVLEGVSKNYDGKKLAVDGLSLTIRAGSVFGFLGPNGAGKTTTVKLLGGLLKPTAGRMRVAGRDPVAQGEKVHEVSQLMTETTMMYDHLTARENLSFYGRLFGLPDGEIRARAEKLLSSVGLSDAPGKLKTFSTGMRQRLSLARVLLTEPEILFLDEPTSGLDPESVKWINRIITDQSARGATVFLCTHQLRYAEEICTDYGLMDAGRLLAAGTLAALAARAGSAARIRVRAKDMPAGRMRETAPGLYETDIESDEDVAALVAGAVRAGASVYEVQTVRDSLEDIYFMLLNKERGAPV